jgi:hypothetical protein
MNDSDMKPITLPSGKPVMLGIWHQDESIPVKINGDELLVCQMCGYGWVHEARKCPRCSSADVNNAFDTHRGTHVKLVIDGLAYEARSVCKPPDNWCAADGRRRAANRLLELLRDKNRFPKLELTKDDRAVIFRAICHEYSPEVTKDRKTKRIILTLLARKNGRWLDAMLKQVEAAVVPPHGQPESWENQ